MKSYGQFCAVAKALDVIGDRWNLLIVRELLLRGPSRYTDLQHGLPGIATNMLSSRLRDLEAGGVVAREAAPPPVATTLFRLTERGEELGPVLSELGRWGSKFIVDAMLAAGTAPESGSDGGSADEDDIFRSHWMAYPASLFFKDADPAAPPVTVEVRTGDQPVVIERRSGKVVTRLAARGDEDADLVLIGPPPLVMGVLSGRLPAADAQARGLEVQGELGVLDELRGSATAAR